MLRRTIEDPIAKAGLRKHLSQIRMIRTEGERIGTTSREETGPNAPAVGLGHSDGCGGLQCTEAAMLVLPFRYALTREVAP